MGEEDTERILRRNRALTGDDRPGGGAIVWLLLVTILLAAVLIWAIC